MTKWEAYASRITAFRASSFLRHSSFGLRHFIERALGALASPGITVITEGSLQRHRMPRDVTVRIPVVGVPAGPDVSAPAQIRGVQAQSGDHRKRVSVSRINRHPAAAAAF